MNKLKKLTIISTVWNIVLLLLLFFQSTFIYSIIKKNLFPTFRFIKPLLDNTFINFIKNRAIITIVTLIVMIIIEIVLFFIVNRILQKKYKEYSEKESEGEIEIQSKNSALYYKWINIYLIAFISVFMVSIIYYSFDFLSYFNKIDLSLNNKTINSIYEITRNIKLTNLVDIESFINISIEKIKIDSDIYKLITEILSFVDVMHYIKMFFYSISYLILMFGIFINARLYYIFNKKELSDE